MIRVKESSNEINLKYVKLDPQMAKPQCITFDPQNPDRAYPDQ